MPQPHIHWITDDESLVQAAVAWHQLPSLAMDTEFKRTSTFWPQTGLIQAAAGEKVWLIDPMHINCWQPLRRLLESRDTIKIMHAMSQDLEIFHRLVQAQPVNLFDTQLAAAYAGLAFSISYQRLVAEVLGVHLTKNETRSDWLARPLTPHQIHYAAQDVFYLAQLLAPLSRTLKNKGYEHWHREDCERQVIASIKSTDPATAWMRVKNARNLNRQQQHILQVLCQWREQQAQQNDISRNFLIPADALWHLAKTQPDSLQRLKKVPGMNAKTVRTLGPEILHQISLGHKRPTPPLPPLPSLLPKTVQPWTVKIKQFCRELASQLELPLELMQASTWLNPLLRSRLEHGFFCLPPHINGWRVQVVITPLIDHLNQWENNTSQTEEVG